MSWIQTYSGLAFDFDPLDTANVEIGDIAHALGNLCRFTGHTWEFYSVAEHSVHVCNLVRKWLEHPKYRLTDPQGAVKWALMHDAAEAYINDLSRPVKRRAELDGYRSLERRVEVVIADRFGLSRVVPGIVKDADAKLLITEASQLLDKRPRPWKEPQYVNLEPLDILLPCLPPREAEAAWLEAAEELGLK